MYFGRVKDVVKPCEKCGETERIAAAFEKDETE